MKELIIEGARQNNLKNINLSLPHDSFIVITGLSGSGKSSLAFDTIFAEGQWRFIESLSTYARLFLEKLDRPDVESIRNIRPAIALQQKNPVKGSRSTVGTLTEIYDLLRVLYSRIGHPFCPECGDEIKQWTVDTIITELLENYNNERAMITFTTTEAATELIKQGYYRYWNGNDIKDLSQTEETNGSFEIVVDRVTIRNEPRLADSLELAYREGQGALKVYIYKKVNGNVRIIPRSFSKQLRCDKCKISLPEPTPILFSFNHPVGACPACKGFGNLLRYDESLIIPDPGLSIAEGAIEPWEKPAAYWWKEQLIEHAKEEGIGINKPYKELSASEKEKLFHGGKSFYGINDFFEELEDKRYKLHVRVFLSRYRQPVTCDECRGTRLKKEALAYRINGFNIAELCSISIGELREFFKNLSLTGFEESACREVLRQINMKLDFLLNVGVEYLTLNRLGKTLSGGEYQRINLANQIGARLTGTLYVLDEPTVGLHASDTERITSILKKMVAMGNTLVVVEHDRHVIEASDWIVELGPGSGSRGGEIIFSGIKDNFLKTETLTSRYIRGFDLEMLNRFRRKAIPKKQFFLTLEGARGNNLKDINVKIPLSLFTVVTGVSGSGKSTLIVETLYRALAKIFKTGMEKPLPFDNIKGVERLKGVRLIDQSPIGRTPRSNPVTYLKIFDLIRKVFASQPYALAHGYTPGFFSFNVPGGRCERCKGEGFEKLEMYFFEDLYVTCEACGGKRYGSEALKVTYKDRNIYEILELTVDEAITHFSEEQHIVSRLQILKDIGLGYLKLGQPATTLSGGEAQRLKICSELITNRKKGILYILDEPTVGLHYRDVISLLSIIRRLVDEGNTVVIIEHNLDLISVADWIVDLGPGGGPDGGRVIYEGPLEGIKNCNESITGRYLLSQESKELLCNELETNR